MELCALFFGCSQDNFLTSPLSGEYVEVTVVGTIKDFMLVEPDDLPDQGEGEIGHDFRKVQDETILLNTYLPDGIPQERLKWRALRTENSP